jgi:succinoglycan biosynthesis protein ExoM
MSVRILLVLSGLRINTMIDSKTAENIAVCIATYQRPVGLCRLLNSLRNLEFRRSPQPKWYVIIIDNDQEGSARKVVKEIRSSFPVPITYHIEATKGIASARNAAVKQAQGADFVAFIDDDELAEPNWLDELLFVQSQYQADVVQGPVLPKFEQDPPKWVARGRFYSWPRQLTGTKLKYAATNNVLIKVNWLHAFQGPFDVRLNLTGGSDTLFSVKIFQLGALGVWADDAVVHEVVPPNRMNASWIIRRKWRYGLTLATIDNLLKKPFHLKILRLMKGCYQILGSLIVFLPSVLFLGYTGVIKSLARFCYGWGEILGLFGVKYAEYL